MIWNFKRIAHIVVLIARVSRLRHTLIVGVVLLSWIGCYNKVYAQGGVSPYLPVNVSPVLENEIDRLATVAGIPNLTKPYSLATIFAYLERVRKTHPQLYGRLTKALEPYTAHLNITHSSAVIAQSDDDIVIPNAYGETTDLSTLGRIRGQWQASNWLGVYLGADVSDDITQYTGSHLALGFDWAQLDIGYREFWWSPLRGSAQVMSTQAQTLPSVSLSNNLPIEFLGARWNYATFVAQPSRQLVSYNNAWSDKDKPYLLGVHLSMQPTPWWTLGASRVLMFGGGERPTDLKLLFEAFFDVNEGDNNRGDTDTESGNQIAAIQSKIHFDGSLPFTFSMEFAGEDTSKSRNYQIGNSAINYGLYFPYFFHDSLSFNYEYSDWQDKWYSHHLYQFGGYVNEGVVMGHWAMQVQRENDTARAGSSHYADFVWQTPWNHVLEGKIRLSQHDNGNISPTDENNVFYQDGKFFELEYTVPYNSHTYSLGSFFGEDNFGNAFSQLYIKANW